MRPIYGEAAWTRNGEGTDKKREMMAKDTRYFIAREATDSAAPAGDGGEGGDGGENANPNAASTSTAAARLGAPLAFVHYR